MEESLFTKCLGNSPPIRIIDFFLDNPILDYSKNEVIRNLGMSRPTFFKYWRELEELGIFKVTRKIGKAKLYKLNEENEIVRKLIELNSLLCKRAMEEAIEREAIKETAR